MALLSNPVLVGAFVVAVTLVGCDWPAEPGTPPTGLVAVIDLDSVARAVGRDSVIASRVQEYADQQSAKLNRLRDDLREQLQQEKSRLGDTPGDADREKLAQLTARMDLQLQQEIAKARQAAEQLKIDLVMDFKQEIQPLAERVVKARGNSILLIRQNAMLYVDPAADITKAVIEELKSTEPAPGAGEKSQ